MKSMNFASRSIHRALIAGCVLLYTVLLVMSTGCTLAHVGQLSSQHHHHGEEGSSTQNTVCAWICQATADAAVAIGPSPTVTELVVGSADLAFSRLVLSPTSSAVHARAPPPIFFVRLG